MPTSAAVKDANFDRGGKADGQRERMRSDAEERERTLPTMWSKVRPGARGGRGPVAEQSSKVRVVEP